MMFRFWRQLRSPLPGTLHLRLGGSSQRNLSDMGQEPCIISPHSLLNALSNETYLKERTPR